MIRKALTVVFATLWPMAAVAQQAQLAGSVRDPQKAAVPKASLRLIEEATDVQLTTQSNERGSYVFASVKPGTYRLEVVADPSQGDPAAGRVGDGLPGAGADRSPLQGGDGRGSNDLNRGQPDPVHDQRDRQWQLHLAYNLPRPHTHSVRRTDTVGTVVEEWEGEIEELPPLSTTLEATAGQNAGTTVPVHLHSKVTEVGTLELSCINRDATRRWKLELNVREKAE